MSGHEVLSTEIHTTGTVDISDLPAGVYILRVGSRSAKLLVQ